VIFKTFMKVLKKIPFDIKHLIFMSILMFTTLYGQQKNSTRNDNIPHLEQKSKTYQLIVDGSPFLILGGELGNSSFTSLEYLKPNWR
jgi:hypothetical protein